MRFWLKNIGAADDPLPAKWYDEGSEEGEFRWFVRFSEAYSGASIEYGDLLLYHAFFAVAGGPTDRRVVGLARVSGDSPVHSPRPGNDRWPCKRAVTPLLIVPLASRGVELGALSVDVPPMGGYKELTRAQIRAGIAALCRKAVPLDPE